MFEDIKEKRYCFSGWLIRSTATIIRQKTLPRTFFSVFDNEYLILQWPNTKNLKTGFIVYYLVTKDSKGIKFGHLVCKWETYLCWWSNPKIGDSSQCLFATNFLETYFLTSKSNFWHMQHKITKLAVCLQIIWRGKFVSKSSRKRQIWPSKALFKFARPTL